LTQGENVHPCPRNKTKKKESSRSKTGIKQRKKIPNQDWKKAKKKERKIPDQRSEENKIYKKFFGPDNI